MPKVHLYTLLAKIMDDIPVDPENPVARSLCPLPHQHSYSPAH